ncbi:hypothetical protein T492DRAFT_850490 [Pavlovales sp. CCMP2436]|nr:hypothetical protein T492DRAFT_850490 [Pavlovales sp. CCMP2436]
MPPCSGALYWVGFFFFFFLQQNMNSPTAQSFPPLLLSLTIRRYTQACRPAPGRSTRPIFPTPPPLSNYPPLYTNMPPCSGALYSPITTHHLLFLELFFIVRGLTDRIEQPMAKLKQTMRTMLATDDGQVFGLWGELHTV